MSTTAAQVIFRELAPAQKRVSGSWQSTGRWEVRLLHPANVTGSVLGRDVSQTRGVLFTVRETPEGHYEWTTPGEQKPNGNRHMFARDWADCQRQIIDWASRRFRVELPA